MVDERSFSSGIPRDDAKCITVYTDWSKLDDGNTGSGVVVRNIFGSNDYSDSFHLGDCASVFQAELYAIYKAAEYLNFRCLERQKIIIYSDSQAALKALASSVVKSAIVRDTLGQLTSLGRRNQLLLRWVKAHAGHHHNDAADELAKHGASHATPLPADVPLAPPGLGRQLLFQRVTEVLTHHWVQVEPCRQTKHWFPSPSRSLSQQCVVGNRKHFSALVQLITGFNHLKRCESYKTHGHDNHPADRLCSFCSDGVSAESSFHFLAECDAFARLRWDDFGAHTLHYPFKLGLSKVKEFLRRSGTAAFALFFS